MEWFKKYFKINLEIKKLVRNFVTQLKNMKQLTEKQIEILQDFANNNNISFVEEYSGRGMYGETCIGFSGNIDLFTLGFNLAQYLLDVDEDSDFLLSELFCEGSESDSLGRGTIVYFPNISI